MVGPVSNGELLRESEDVMRGRVDCWEDVSHDG